MAVVSPAAIATFAFLSLVIGLVFPPLLVLPGIEGHVLRPLGYAYLASLAGSRLVALTMTRVLCLLLRRRLN